MKERKTTLPKVLTMYASASRGFDAYFSGGIEVVDGNIMLRPKTWSTIQKEI